MYPSVEAVLDAVRSASYFDDQVGQLGVNTRDIFGDRPLHVVITWGDIDAVKLLISAGAQVDAPGEDGNTALHHALSMGHFNIARLLLGCGASQTIRNREGKLARDMCWEGEWDGLGLLRD
jgi:ankyrin repeat protein